MAIKYYETYPQRWESPSQDYPQGAFKNLSALGEQDGSYLEKDWLNDQAGFFGALLRNAEMTPNGLVDTAQKSQFYDALVAVAEKVVVEKGMTENELISKSVGAGKWMREGAFGVGRSFLGADDTLLTGTLGGFGNYSLMRSFRTGGVGFELRNFYSQDKFEMRRHYSGTWQPAVELYHSKNTVADKNGVLHKGTTTPLNTLNTSDMSQEVVDNDLFTVTSGAVYRALEGKFVKDFIANEWGDSPDKVLSQEFLSGHFSEDGSLILKDDGKEWPLPPVGGELLARFPQTTNIDATNVDDLMAIMNGRSAIGSNIEINLLNFDKGISLIGGDYSNFTIIYNGILSSVDTANSNGSLFYLYKTNPPTLDIKADCDGKVLHGLFAIDSGTVVFKEGSYIKEVRQRAFYLNNGRATVSGCEFTSLGTENPVLGRALWLTRGAILVAENTKWETLGASACVYISRASTAHMPYSTFSAPDADHIVWIHRGSNLNAQECVKLEGGKVASINVHRNSIVTLNGTASLTQVGGIAFNVSGLSRVLWNEGGNISPTTDNNGVAIKLDSSQANLNGITIADGFQKCAELLNGSALSFVLSTAGSVKGVIGIDVLRKSVAIVTGSKIFTNTSGNDLRVTFGGEVIADKTMTTNSVGDSPKVEDTNVAGFGGFNAVASSGRGIIWV